MTYDIASREVPDQPIVSIRERHPLSELPAFIGRSFGEIYQHLALLGAVPSGEPFIIYHSFGPDDLDVEACAPIAREVVATGRISARVLSATTVAETLHVGPYEALGEAYGALTGWIAQNGYEVAGPVRETYLNEPGPGVPPEAYRTRIAMPIAMAAVAAR